MRNLLISVATAFALGVGAAAAEDITPPISTAPQRVIMFEAFFVAPIYIQNGRSVKDLIEVSKAICFLSHSRFEQINENGVFHSEAKVSVNAGLWRLNVEGVNGKQWASATCLCVAKAECVARP